MTASAALVHAIASPLLQRAQADSSATSLRATVCAAGREAICAQKKAHVLQTDEGGERECVYVCMCVCVYVCVCVCVC